MAQFITIHPKVDKEMRPLIISPYHLYEAFQRPETRLFDVSLQRSKRHVKRSVFIDTTELPGLNQLYQENQCLQFLNRNGVSQGAYNVFYVEEFDERFFYFLFFLFYFGVGQLSVVSQPISLVIEQYPELGTNKYLKKNPITQLGVKGWKQTLTDFRDELKVFFLCGESQTFPQEYNKFPQDFNEFVSGGILIDPLALANRVRTIMGQNKDAVVFGSLKFTGFFLLQAIKPYLNINVQLVPS